MAFLAAAGLLVAVTGAVLWRRWQPAAPPVVDDPRLTYATPYRNVHPDVQYVGDATCALCHPTQTDSYRHHPMGRSLAPVAQIVAEHRYDKAAGNPVNAFDLELWMDRRGDRLIERQVRRGPQGEVQTQVEDEILYTVGSNTRGRSFFAVRDGRVFQTSVSWFTQGGTWDLAPGRRENQLAGRPVTPACLFCHTNQAEPVPFALNHYRPPLFRGYAIGCERCHGPGELHAARRERGEVVNGLDDTIVNPRDLEPALREAVCQQCHLEGESRVLRRHRDFFDFRPGLPLHLFWSVFVKPAELTHDYEAVSHVEQMYVSRCFQAGRGKLGCISCHDPHEAPAADKKAGFYRKRCLTCHEQKGCSLPEPARRQREKDDSCIACHMPRMRSADIAHTAVTDHRVRRVAEPGPKDEGPMRLPPGKSFLTHFHQDLVAPNDPGVSRDLGLALVELGQMVPQVQRQLAREALGRLEDAVKAEPNDPPAWTAYASALFTEGRPKEALAALEAALARAPEYESALSKAANLAEMLQLPDAAVAYGRRLLAVNPHYALYHQDQARRLANNRQWAEAVTECETVLRYNPADLKTRQLLVLIHARSGDRERARKEFEALIALAPPEPAALRQWFAELLR
jgi:Flp pilus assembly protein TadD